MPSPLRDDIVVNGLQLKLYRQNKGPARGIAGTDQAQLATDQFIDEDLPQRQDTWHLGAGYSLRLIPGTYAYAINGDGRFPRMFQPGPLMNAVTLTSATDSCRWAMDVGSDTYFGGGRFAYRAVGGSASSPLASTNDLGAANVGYSAVNWIGNGYVGTDASGTPGTLWKVTGANAWSSGTANRRHLTPAYYNNTNGYRLFGQTDTAGLNEVKTIDPASDPLVNASWGTAITFGDASGVTINRLVALQDHVYAATDRGLFDFDGATGKSFNVTPQIGQRRNSQNGLACHVGDQWVYFGHKHGLSRYQAQGLNAGVVAPVTFGHGLPNETPIRGQVTASCQDQGWVVQAIWNGTDTYICYGREIAAGDTIASEQLGLGYGPSPLAISPNQMLWHGGLVKLAGVQCWMLFISGQTDPPKCWVGAGANVQWFTLPRTENPQQDSEYRFATSYSVIMPYEDWGRPATNKNLIQLDVEGDNLGIGASIAYKYSVDGAAFASLGTANSSPLATVLPGTEIIGRRIALRADGTNSNTAGANMRAYILRAAERVTIRALRTYQVDLMYDGGDRLGGHRMSQPLKTLEALRTLAAAGQVTMRDEFGATLTVLIKPPVEWHEVHSDSVSDKEQGALHLVATLRVSVLKRLSGTFHWNDGTTFGQSGKSYG